MRRKRGEKSNKRKEQTYVFSIFQSHSHEVVVAQSSIVVVGRINLVVSRGHQRDLGLGRLTLLAALVSRALLLHLLVAQCGQGAGDLLDVAARQILDQLLGEILGPQRILGLLRLRRQQRGQRGRQPGELVLGGGLEERHGRQVDGLRGVGRVADDHGLRGAAVAVQIDVAEQVLGVLEIRILLGAAQPGAFGGLVLVTLGVLGFFGLLSPGAPVLLYPLRLALLLCGGFGLRLGLGLCCLGLLLPLYFGVFGGIPRVEDLFQIGRIDQQSFVFDKRWF